MGETAPPRGDLRSPPPRGCAAGGPAEPVPPRPLVEADSSVAVAGPLPFGIVVPFVDTLGCELWHFGEGRAELRLSIDETLQNSWGTAHGGVLMTLLDVAMAQAARSADRHRDPATPPRGMATIEMKTSFLRPAEGRLRAEGALLHRTATLAFTEGRVLDESGAVCAHATGTFKYLAALPVSRHESRQQKPRHAEPRARNTKE